ncbi:hypothetical protein [Streptomyces sp. NPDC001410]
MSWFDPEIALPITGPMTATGRIVASSVEPPSASIKNDLRIMTHP